MFTRTSMEYDDDKPKDKVATTASLYGAIFMCNRSTKQECFERMLFGLPYSQANFVKQVKAGMILFLFEYEERKLYGVFQATSNGSMNIVPQAFKSLGKQIPAQIRVKRLWKCDPLFEHEFRDALRDNYFAPKKFNGRLSEAQVEKLLSLFSSRKLPQRANNHRGGIKVRQRSGRSGLGRIRVADRGRYLVKDTADTVARMQHDAVRLTKSPGLPRTSFRDLSCNPDKLIIEREDRMDEGNHRFPLVASGSVEPQIAYSDPYIFGGPINISRLSTPFGMDHDTTPVTPQVHAPEDTFCQYSRSQLMPSHMEPENVNRSSTRNNLDAADNLGDYIPLPHYDDIEPCGAGCLFPEAENFGNRDINFEEYRRQTFQEPTLTSLPFLRDEVLERGNMYSAALTLGKGPSPVPDNTYLATSHHGHNREGTKYCYEPSAAALSLSRERKSFLAKSVCPSESRAVDEGPQSNGTAHHKNYGGQAGKYYNVHGTGVSDHNENYREFGLPYDTQKTTRELEDNARPFRSDTQKRRISVFSRLALAPYTATEDDEPMGNEDVKQVMELLHQNRNRWLTSIQVPDDGDDDACHYQELTELEVTEDAVVVDEDGKISEKEGEEVPVINFKRRSEVRRAQVETDEGGIVKSLDVEILSGTPPKKRKLRRPSFGSNAGECNGDGETGEALAISDTSESTKKDVSEDVQNEGNSKRCRKGITGEDFGSEVVPQGLSQDALVAAECNIGKPEPRRVLHRMKNQNTEKYSTESKTSQVNSCPGSSDDQEKQDCQSCALGKSEAGADFARCVGSKSELNPQELLAPPSHCETKDQQC